MLCCSPFHLNLQPNEPRKLCQSTQRMLPPRLQTAAAEQGVWRFGQVAVMGPEGRLQVRARQLMGDCPERSNVQSPSLQSLRVPLLTHFLCISLQVVGYAPEAMSFGTAGPLLRMVFVACAFHEVRARG